MYEVPPARLPLDPRISFDFSGGELTSDGGLLLVGQMARALGVREALGRHLESHPLHTFDDADLVMQKAMLVTAGYRADDDATDLRDDPAFAGTVGRLASQETLSRRFSAMGPSDVGALRAAVREVQDRVAENDERRAIVVDFDTTLLSGYGSQEGLAWNFHYSGAGLHPIVATDTEACDVVGFELRPGAQHCSKDAGPFIGGVLDRITERHPDACVAVRADAGFSSPEVYAACERYGCAYAVRLKSNARLHELAAPLASLLEPGSGLEAYGSFAYRAASWDRERRVAVRCETPDGELLVRSTFVVTDMAAPPRDVFAFYRGRGAMELVIGELKDGFLRNCVQSKSMAANEFRCLTAILAYSLLNWLRRLALPARLAREKAATVRSELVKVAARRVSHGRRVLFRLPSSYPRKSAFYHALHRIWEIASG